MMKYEVYSRVNSEIVSTHRSKKAAIAAAKKLADEDQRYIRENWAVNAHEVSGTYESHQQVWPTQGECYSN